MINLLSNFYKADLCQYQLLFCQSFLLIIIMDASLIKAINFIDIRQINYLSRCYILLPKNIKLSCQ